jgi:hypothetical protein
MPYTRKTHDEYDIEGNYGQGWEVVTTEETYRAAREQLKCYRENEPQYPHRIKCHRVRNDEVTA